MHGSGVMVGGTERRSVLSGHYYRLLLYWQYAGIFTDDGLVYSDSA